jgi:hypothetical protein
MQSVLYIVKVETHETYARSFRDQGLRKKMWPNPILAYTLRRNKKGMKQHHEYRKCVLCILLIHKCLSNKINTVSNMVVIKGSAFSDLFQGLHFHPIKSFLFIV